MPYVSQAQRKFFHSPGAKRAGITKADIKHWDTASKGLKLPARKKKKSLPSRKELISEHKELIPALRRGSKPELKRIATEQSRELKGLKSKKKARFVVNNKMKSFGRMDTKTNVIEINRKKHRGDKRELADTIKHEMYHVKHPKANEKTVYKKTGHITEMTRAEQDRMIAKLRMKKLNYKTGAAKRKLKIHRKVEPGELIRQMNASKTPRTVGGLPKNPSERTAIMGAI